MPQELMTLSEGATIQGQNGERFVVEELLGTGGFSSIYLVRERRTRSRLYVLKEISDPNTYEKRHLTFEGEILKRLEHPSLPHVHQVFENGRRFYMLMDYIEGSDLEMLRDMQPGKRFSLHLTLTLMMPVIEAVRYLHDQQPPVIHRDIKPANIIVPIGAGEPKLVDFGLAKEYEEEKTTNVFRYGTPGYAAPEQYVQGTNPCTDIYALGATIYTLLSGIVPTDALTRNLGPYDEDPLLPLYMLNQDIPVPVSNVIEKAMSLRSKDRYATVEEFWQALNTAFPMRHPRTEPIALDSPLFTLAPTEVPKPRTYKLNEPVNKPRVHTPAPHSHSPRRLVHTRKKFLYYATCALFACIILGLAFTGILFYSSSSSQKPNTPQKPNIPQKPAIIENTCMSEILTPIANNSPGDFPSLASCYAGTVTILGISHSQANLFLFHIRQSLEAISGDCTGFGTTCTFNGLVTKQGMISFTVKLQNQERLLYFEGTIGSAGELVIHYNDLDQNGHKMQNEYGNGRLQAFTTLDLTPTPS